MALPLLAIAAGAGLLGLLALSSSKPAPAAAQPGAAVPVVVPPPPPPPPPTPGAPVMPAALQAQFTDLLNNGVNADALDTVAAEMEKFGFMNEGATLRARATQLRQAAAANAAAQAAAQAAAAQQPPPFVPGVLDSAPPAATSAAAQLAAQAASAAQALAAQAAAQGISIPVIAPPPPTPAAQQARVTTNDAPPSGDLIMRVAPSDSAAQVPGGGAEKNGIVTILNPNASADGVWSEIDWPGGSRRPAARGFGKKKFLVNLPPSPSTSGIVVGAAGTRYARCVAPSGCRLRVAPSTMATFRAMVGSGETLQVLQHAQGAKADRDSPGPGGWAQVKYKNLTGWLPSEWLAAA